jgi:poly-gamma-glutamate capsule biosynthesis protein CapA/YwtB (metallophosphatase superfamily)
MKYILLSICILGGIWFVSSSKTIHAPTISSPIKKEAAHPVELAFVGDIMFDRSVGRSIENNFNGDYSALFSNTGYLKDVDIAFGNLEGPVATGGYKVGSRFSFRMDPKGLVAMHDAGFDIVSFANNHVGDYTLAAFNETRSRLTEEGIGYTGAGDNYADVTTPRVLTVRGVRIGFLAATDVGPEWMKATTEKPGILLANDPDMENIISRAKAQVDVLVVSFHWGNEYSPANAHQVALAHKVIDSGADIVVGHHPHVMERIEVYKDKPIFYSLGNFIFDQYFSVHTLRGMVGFVTIDPDTKKIIARAMISPLSRQYIPQPLIPFDESLLVQKTFTP